MIPSSITSTSAQQLILQIDDRYTAKLEKWSEAESEGVNCTAQLSRTQLLRL
jgi:hypothetical protein